MSGYSLVLRSLKNPNEHIVLEKDVSQEYAETQRKNWRRVLGNKHWTVDRRPGLDTLDHLALSVENQHEQQRRAEEVEKSLAFALGRRHTS